MKKAIFYIGANNQTKKLEQKKIEVTMNKYFEGYSAMQIIGYWKGQRERTMMVQVVSDSSDAVLSRCAVELCDVLQQDSVMLEVVESNVAFISR